MQPLFLAIRLLVFASAAEVWSLDGEDGNSEGRGSGIKRRSSFPVASWVLGHVGWLQCLVCGDIKYRVILALSASPNVSV